jgi:ferredoxin, 2Fe-2S
MPHLIITSRTGEERQMEGESGQSLMEVLHRADVGDIRALCGGCCACATCHVYVDTDFYSALPPMAPDEKDLLDSLEFRLPNSRLSCQLRLGPELENLRVTVAPEE